MADLFREGAQCSSRRPPSSGGVRSGGAPRARCWREALAPDDRVRIGRVFDIEGLRPSEIGVESRGAREVLDVRGYPDGRYEVAGEAFTVERGELGPQLLPASLVASVHVPRTAGTSFRTALSQAWGEDLALDYGDQPLSSDYPARKRRAREGPGLFLPASTRAVHGHFLASKYGAAAPRRAVWVRDPVERAVSHYRFWLRTAGDDDPNETKRRFLSGGRGLAGFTEMAEMRDVHARLLDGASLAEFAFVGLFEQYERGLRLFARVFGLSQPLRLVVLNANPLPPLGPRPAVPDEDRRRIAALNRVDVELYAEAARRFAALCREHGVD